jgi:hypothetical protein
MEWMGNEGESGSFTKFGEAGVCLVCLLEGDEPYLKNQEKTGK